MASKLPELAKQKIDDSFEVTIVHIPNIPHHKSTLSPQDTWPKLLPQLVTGNAKVIQFQHGLNIEDPFSWRQLSESGIKLLNLLFDYQPSQKEANNPLILITEGLGGLILKWTLVTADGQRQRFKGFLDSIVGLILVGVPHIKGTDDDTLQRLVTLLRPGLSKVSKKSISRDQISSLELLSERFRDIYLPLPEGLISGYETLGTSLASGALSIRKTVAVLVGKEFAKIDWPRDLEQLLPLDVHLDAVFRPHRVSRFRTEVANYIKKVVTAASSILERSRTQQTTQSFQVPIRQSTLVEAPPVQPASATPTSLGSGPSIRPSVSPTGSSFLAAAMANRRSPPRETSPSMLGTSSQSDSSFEVLTNATSFTPPSKRLNLPIFMVRPHIRNKRFWPRTEELEAIEDALINKQSTQRQTDDTCLHTFVLHGMGGVGKTELATEFVFKNQDKFEAIFFLHADNRARLVGELVRMAIELDLNDGTDADAAQDAVKSWLANPIRQMINLHRKSGSFSATPSGTSEQPDFAKWLIVFDNADDPDLLLDFWPGDGVGSILVTSRDPMAKDNYYFGEVGLELKGMSEDDGAAFLRSMTGYNETESTEKSSKIITSRLGGLPLAIEQIGAIIRRNGLSLAGFLRIYKDDEDLETLHDQRIAKNRGYEHSMAGVWALADLPPESVALLNVMTFLDPDRIHSRMLIENLSVTDLEGYPRSEAAFTAALTRLVQSSIVSRSWDSAELRVHRLVQDVARARMRKFKILEAYFDAVVDILWTDFPKITRGGVGRAQRVDRWDRCAHLFPHISKLAEFYKKSQENVTGMKHRAKFADLLNEAGWYQHERTNPTDTTPMVELAQKICEKLEGDHSEQLALILGTRTWSSALMKEYEKVFAYAEERLELEQRMFERSGKITSNLAAAYNDKAAAWSMNRLPAKAFPLLDKSQRLREAMPAFRPEHNFSPLHERSLAHWCQDEHVEAADCLLLALRQRLAALGENDRQSVRTGQLYYALGNVRASQGLSDPAILAESAMWHQKALIHYRGTAGDRHYRTACACYRVAEHCIREKQYEVASESLNQSIDVFKSRSYYQQEHARALFLYHQLHILNNNTAKADEMLTKSVNAWNKAFPMFNRTKEDLNGDDFINLCTYDF